MSGQPPLRASPARGLGVLASEAFRDGLRRRLVAIVAAVLVLGIASAHSCTQLGLGAISVDGRTVDRALVAGFVAPMLFAFQGLVVLAVAGLLAADHLARPIAEGSAGLWLARPVSRHTWVAARLAGALGVALGAGALLLGATGAMLVWRQGVTAAPALAAAAATALGALVVASLAMAASLALGRTAVVLLALLGLGFVIFANGIALVSALVHPEVELGGLVGAVDRWGPPLFTSIATAVAAWNPHVEAAAGFAAAMLRLAMWAGAALALLFWAFSRREIEG